MIDLYVVAVLVLIALEIFTIGFAVGIWFAEKEDDEQDDEQEEKTNAGI